MRGLAGSRLGSGVALGDLDGDGLPEAGLGGPDTSPAGRAAAGAVVVAGVVFAVVAAGVVVTAGAVVAAGLAVVAAGAVVVSAG